MLFNLIIVSNYKRSCDFFLHALVLTLFRMGFFGAAHRWEQKRSLSITSVTQTYNGESGHNYILAKEDPKNI